VRWLRRTRGDAPSQIGPEEPEDATGPPAVERAAPGMAAFFSELEEDGSHAVLDLGPAVEANFRLYGRFARRIRFADLLNAPLRGETWEAILRSFPPHPEDPYDLVLAWDLLDRLPPEHRPQLVEALARVTTSGARLYVVVDASGDATTQPLRFTLHGTDKVVQQTVGEPLPAWPQLLPAEVERLLRPFQVVQAFTLRLGYREYVLVRGGLRPSIRKRKRRS
jgi:hypothetical protein